MINCRVISMRYSQDRRQLIEKNLPENPQIKWAFFDGLTADDSDCISGDPAEQAEHYGRALTPQEIGCFRSHYHVLEWHAKHGDTEWLVIFEDDIWLDPDFDFNEIVAACDAHSIDSIRLYASAHMPAHVICKLSNFRHIIRFTSTPWGAQAYMFRRSGAQRFVQNVSRIIYPIDDELGRYWVHDLPIYCVYPFPVVERSMPSTIEDSRIPVANETGRWHTRRFFGRLKDRVRRTIYDFKLRRSNR